MDFLRVGKHILLFSETDKVRARSLEKIPSFICTFQKIVGAGFVEVRLKLLCIRPHVIVVTVEFARVELVYAVSRGS